MGGSPRPAVDNIREILGITRNRNDYLGETLPIQVLSVGDRNGILCHSVQCDPALALSHEGFPIVLRDCI